ncbi:GerAB/ArcD/ProY family transporter [Bacillus sp. 03113]|uniref:GerAB/ArcD/ProY family transporter n=1 Tax=Bacillus sp. 03113 TaxID=2578211 RepID=UPI0011433582|nr:GerAB/ArcD/ProY family transporter [Bacillus sp. 03113]
MEKAKISVTQLFALMFLFEMGTAIVVSLGSQAKKDAWLAILLGLCGGIILFFIYYFLFRRYPNLPLTAYTRKIFGQYLGWIIGLLYVVYFLYLSARNLRDFGDLLLSSTMQKTPLLAINILIIVAICYVLYLGIEVLGRTAEVFFLILIILGVVGNFLVFVSGNINFENLLPFLENGWKPILKTAFPLTTFFPFSEMMIFTMLLPYLNKSDLVKKVWLSALISSGLIVSFTSALNIAVLGDEKVEKSTFPLLSTIGTVNLFEFIQRLDSIVVVTMLITMFFKIAIYIYGAAIGAADLFQLKNYQRILFPFGVIVTFLSMAIASEFSEHIEEGQKIVPNYLFIPLHIIIPLLMLIVAYIRSRLRSKGKQN